MQTAEYKRSDGLDRLIILSASKVLAPQEQRRFLEQSFLVWIVPVMAAYILGAVKHSYSKRKISGSALKSEVPNLKEDEVGGAEKEMAFPLLSPAAPRRFITWRSAAILLAILLALSWLPRLRYSFMTAGGNLYRLDRITGRIVCIQGDSATAVDMP